MSIIGIEGGIGTGKTLTLAYYGITDLLKGKRIFSIITFRNIGKLQQNVTYLTKDEFKNMINLIKEKKFSMINSTVLIQEAHNYIDSRTSMFKDNRMISYWILQSRHTGEGSCDIVYDTQEFTQVDIRLRRNTDYFLRPLIMEWDIIKGKKLPRIVLIYGQAKLGHKQVKFNHEIDVRSIRDLYNTHEIVEF